MGISFSTALQIQNNPVLVGVHADRRGKFSCIIMHGEEKRFRILLSSAPIYETAVEAEQFGQTTVDKIKGMDLSPQKEDLKALLSKEEQEVISKIVNAS